MTPRPSVQSSVPDVGGREIVAIGATDREGVFITFVAGVGFEYVDLTKEAEWSTAAEYTGPLLAKHGLHFSTSGSEAYVSFAESRQVGTRGACLCSTFHVPRVLAEASHVHVCSVMRSATTRARLKVMLSWISAVRAADQIHVCRRVVTFCFVCGHLSFSPVNHSHTNACVDSPVLAVTVKRKGMEVAVREREPFWLKVAQDQKFVSLLNSAPLAQMAIRVRREFCSEWQETFKSQGVVLWATMAWSGRCMFYVSLFRMDGVFRLRGHLLRASVDGRDAQKPVQHRTEKHIMAVPEDVTKALRSMPQELVQRTEQIVDDPRPLCQEEVLDVRSPWIARRSKSWTCPFSSVRKLSR